MTMNDLNKQELTVERDFMGAIHIKLGDFDFIQIQYRHPITDNAGTRELARKIVGLLEGRSVEAERDQLRAEGEALRKDAAAIRRQFEYWKQRARSAEGHIYSPKSDLRCAAKALQPRTRLRDRAWHELSELEQYELMLAAHDVIRAVDQSRHARRPKDMSVISASSCGGPSCCQLCADEKAGEVGNG